MPYVNGTRLKLTREYLGLSLKDMFYHMSDKTLSNFPTAISLELLENRDNIYISDKLVNYFEMVYQKPKGYFDIEYIHQETKLDNELENKIKNLCENDKKEILKFVEFLNHRSKITK